MKIIVGVGGQLMSRIGDMDFCQKLPPPPPPLLTEGENVALLATPIFPNPPPPLPLPLKSSELQWNPVNATTVGP